jgi:hypothetical protein
MAMRMIKIDDAGGHKDGKGDHLLKFDREKLRCVVRVSNLPRLRKSRLPAH